MSEYRNRLSPADAERLALLAEECAEVIQVIGKILRHGYGSRHPNGGLDNRVLLHNELGDVQCAMALMCDAGDLDADMITERRLSKRHRVGRYLHHQDTTHD